MSFFDEMFADSETTRLCYRKYYSWLNSPEQKNIVKRKDEAENVFRRTGITFNVYSEKEETKTYSFRFNSSNFRRRKLEDNKEGWNKIKAINSFFCYIINRR